MFLWEKCMEFIFVLFRGALSAQSLVRSPFPVPRELFALHGRSLCVRRFLHRKVPFLGQTFLPGEVGVCSGGTFCAPELPHGPVVSADGVWSVLPQHPHVHVCPCTVFRKPGEKLKCKTLCTYLHRHASIMHVCLYTHSFASQLLSHVPKNYLIFKSLCTHCASTSLNMNIL